MLEPPGPVHLPAGPIFTRRLVLDRVGAGDRDDVVALNADPVVMRYLGDGYPMPADRTVAEEMSRLTAHARRADGLGFWTARTREPAGPVAAAGEFVGWFGATPVRDGVVELGYRLHQRFWGQGYATEGAARMVELAAAAGARSVVGTTMTVNLASRRVMEKVGLRLVRTWFGDWDEPIPGAEHGDVDYELTLPVEGAAST
jgi:RimJ/RimL family protein N-acetyltransferase